MATPKTMACRCEDITVDDCEHAIDEGYTRFEDLKRFLGVATGPCQGKSCVQACTRILAERTGEALEDIDVMTFRPPVRPVSFATLAAEADEGSAPQAPDGNPVQGVA